MEKPSNSCGEGVDADDVVGDLAHDEDLQPVLAALQPVARHGRDHPPRLILAADERHHDLEIGEAHLLAHAAQGGALKSETGGVGRMVVARGPAEAQHRVFFLGLEARAADQAGVFVGLEVRQAARSPGAG